VDVAVDEQLVVVHCGAPFVPLGSRGNGVID
jgi:hypothetical protein